MWWPWHFPATPAGATLKALAPSLRASCTVAPRSSCRINPLLHLVDAWLWELTEEDFIASLPLLRRSFAVFDSVARRRLVEAIAKGPQHDSGLATAPGAAQEGPFVEALPLLYRILGIGARP